MDALKISLLIVLFGTYWMISGCESKVQPDSTTIGENISIEWRLISNEIGNGNRYRAAFTLENHGSDTLGNSGWTLYFNYRHNISEETVSKNAEIKFINGDFRKLTPTDQFELAPGKTTTIEYEGEGYVIKDDRAPKGLYFVFTDDQGNETDTTLVRDYTFQPIKPEQVKQAIGFVTDAESRFRANENTETLNLDDLTPILPTPKSIRYSRGSLRVNGDTQIHYDNGLYDEARFLANALRNFLDEEVNISESSESGPGIIFLHLDRDETGKEGDEAYEMEISEENGVQISGSGYAGVFYGIQSLLHLIPTKVDDSTQSSMYLPALTINDSPRFPYRGMHLDVARNFNGKQAVFKLLDLMAFYKLNTFHFHLADDEGWRLQIEELPELTEVGAFRGHTLTDENHLQPSYGSGPFPDPESGYGSGYFTRKDYEDIIRYAHERHIEVIPEFDVPGHARAAIKAMENRYHRLMKEGRENEANEYLLTDWDDESVYSSAQRFHDNVISVCRESAYRFFETVVDDVVEMHEEAGVPLHTIHMGGDEVPKGVWERSPLCSAFIKRNDAVESVEELPGYFVERVSGILAEHGLTLAGWQEIAMRGGRYGDSEIDRSFADNDVLIYSWDNTGANRDSGYRLANTGYPVVICNITDLYFNVTVDSDPAEPGAYIGAFVDNRKVFKFPPMNFTHPVQDESGKISDENVHITSFGKLNIKGIQGHLWSEPIKGPDSLEYFYAPKILALAERAWAGQPAWETMKNGEQRMETFTRDWTQFANRLGQVELPRLDYMFGGFNYRIPPPGAIIENGSVRANVEFPGLIIRYTTDGSLPTADSKIYQAPIEAEGQMNLRTFNAIGRGSRLVTINR